MSSLQSDKSKKIVYNNLLKQSDILANSVAFDQYDSGDFYGTGVCGKKIKNKILINNAEPKLVRPNRTTQNLKHRKNDAKRDNKGSNHTYGQPSQKSKQRSRSRNSSSSNLSWQKSLRSDKTEKKSNNRSPSFKLFGLNMMRSGQLSNSNSKSLSLIKSTSRTKHKSPNVSLKKKTDKETLKKSHKLHLKSTQLQKPKKIKRRSSGKRHQVSTFQIDQQNQLNRKNSKQKKQLKRYIESNRNKQKTNEGKNIKNDAIQRPKKKQGLQRLQRKRRQDSKASTQFINANNLRAKYSNEVVQDSNSSCLLSPIYNQLKGKAVENEKSDRFLQKQNKKTNLKNLMKMQYVKGFQGFKQMKMEHIGNFERQLLSKPKNELSHNIFDKYMNGYATSRDYYWLVSAATKIQKLWRGFRDRKYFYKSLKQATSSYQSIQKNKDLKNQEFWSNNSSNSIIQIEKQFQEEHRIKKVEWINSLRIPKKQQQPQSISEVKSGFTQLPQSGQQCPKQLRNLMKKLHNKFTKPKFLEIPAINQKQNSGDSQIQEQIGQQKNKLLKQERQKEQQQKQRIAQLEKRLREGQEKYRNLQEQLNRMKLLIVPAKPAQSEQPNDNPNPSNKERSGNSNPLYFDQYYITSSRVSQSVSSSNQKMSSQQFITPRQSRDQINQSPNQNELPSGITGNLSSTIKISNYQESEQPSQRGSQKSFKDFSRFKNRIEELDKNTVDLASCQSFQQSLRHSMKPQSVFHSPRQGSQRRSNTIDKQQETKLSSLSQDRISQLFLKKQIKVDQLYEKKAFMFQNLLSQNILSPKTYESKIFMLRESCSKEKSQIQTKLKQAQNVISYLKHIEDEFFPQKISKSQNQKVDKKNALISPIKKVDCYYSSPSPMKEFERVSELQCSLTPEGSKIELQKSDKKSATKFVSVQETKNTSGKKQGFDTSISFIKSFCIQLSNYIRAHDNDTLQKINAPIDQDSFLMLQAYRTNQDLEHVSQYNVYANAMLYPYFKYIIDRDQIVGKQTFREFLKLFEGENNNSSSRKIQSSYNEEQNDDKILKLYFHEMLFDAFNEAMNYQRPYGVKGKGFAWSKQIGKLVKEPKGSYENKNSPEAETRMNEFFGKSIGRIMHWSQFLCGFFPELPDESSFNLTYDENSKKQMRQKRMALMLQNSIVQAQQTMKDIEDQITETKLFLSQQILDQLIEELVRLQIFNI